MSCDSPYLPVIQAHLVALCLPIRKERVIEVIIPLEKWQKFIFFPAIVLPCCQFLLEAHGAPEKQKQNVQP